MRRLTRSPGWRVYGGVDNLVRASWLRFGDEQTRWNSALMAQVEPMQKWGIACWRRFSRRDICCIPVSRF
jgi:hypothetical protein